MATEPKAGLSYADLQGFPDDNLRRELIGGELVVTPAPSTRHQRVVVALVVALDAYGAPRGGQVYPAPTDVYFSDKDVVEPDVLYLKADNAGRIEPRFVRSAPDLVVEVSSPSTRRLELVRKRRLYESYAVPEYWFVDHDAERIEVYRLREGGYGPPVLLERGDLLESTDLPGFSIPVESVLGTSET